jgi:hypothetical protein
LGRSEALVFSQKFHPSVCVVGAPSTKSRAASGADDIAALEFGEEFHLEKGLTIVTP